MKWVILVFLLCFSFVSADLLSIGTGEDEISFGYGNQIDLFFSGTDTTPPTITTINPVFQDDEKTNPIEFIIQTDEVATCTYAINGDPNESMTTSNNLTHTNSKAQSNGNHLVNYYCTDSLGNNGTNSNTFTVAIASDGSAGSGTDTSVTYDTIETIGSSNVSFSKINLEKIEILNEKLCLIDKLKFKTIDKFNKFTLVDTVELEINEIIQSDKLFLDLTNEEYYYDLELELGELEVKITTTQNGKSISETKILNVEKCISLQEISKDKLTILLNCIKDNAMALFWIFIIIFILGLTSYIVFAIKNK